MDFYNEQFWLNLDKLVKDSKVVIDRPKGSRHPKHKNLVYAVDYGYLKGTTSTDGGGIDVWKGSVATQGVDSVMCIVDLHKRDSEIKLLMGCSAAEKKVIYEFHNKSKFMKGIMINRNNKDEEKSKLELKKFSELDCTEICSWRYEGEYSVYNLPDLDKAAELKLGFTNETIRDREFMSIYEKDELIGYFRFIDRGDHLKFAIGLKPSYCGIGYSNTVIPMVLDFAKEKYGQKPIVLEVRTFNNRAIKTYYKFGFKRVDIVYRSLFSQNVEFLAMKNDTYYL